VAGIATANSDNNIGSLGLAAKCTLLPIQIADDVNPKRLSSTHIIDGILYALNKGADVINISLGGSITGFEEWTKQDSVNFKNARYDESIFWSELYSKLEENNVMVVLAAGNDSVPLELDPMHNSTYPVFVCASGPYNELANFPIGGSNYPSQNNDSMTVVVAPGFIWSLIPNNNYEVFSGTSMSAPLVASVITLMKSEYPEISNDQIRSNLLSCPLVGESNIPLVWMPTLFNQTELES
jgi:subtilisin family serine protease